VSEPVLPGMFAPPVHPMTTQAQQMTRVRDGIGGDIVAFWKGRLAGTTRDRLFYAADLYAFLEARQHKTAPGSPDRVMRDMRTRREINYRLVSRSKSLYEAIHLEEAL
jgi:hypothetical protein